MMKKLSTIFLLSVFLLVNFNSYAQFDALVVGLTPDSSKIDTPIVKTTEQKSLDSAIQYPFPPVVLKKQKSDSTLVGNIKKEVKNIQNIREIFSFGKIFWSIIILIITYISINLITKILRSLAEKSTEKRYLFKSIEPFIKILGWIFAITIIITVIFQPPFETIIAVMASVGIAIGFASQDILKNIFGGIMIVFDRPFQVGDKIEVGDHYGEVVEIGLRCTRIVTKDDSLVSVPNSEVVNTAVSNSNSGESNCQVVAEIWLPIDVDTTAARKIAIETAQVSKYVYLNKPIVIIFVNEVKERRSYLKMRIKAYVSDTRNEFPFMSDMTEIVLKELLIQKIIKKEDLN